MNTDLIFGPTRAMEDASTAVFKGIDILQQQMVQRPTAVAAELPITLQVAAGIHPIAVGALPLEIEMVERARLMLGPHFRW